MTRSTMTSRLTALIATLPADLRLTSGSPEGAARRFAEQFLSSSSWSMRAGSPGGWLCSPSSPENWTWTETALIPEPGLRGTVARGFSALWDALRDAGLAHREDGGPGPGDDGETRLPTYVIGRPAPTPEPAPEPAPSCPACGHQMVDGACGYGLFESCPDGSGDVPAPGAPAPEGSETEFTTGACARGDHGDCRPVDGLCDCTCHDVARSDDRRTEEEIRESPRPTLREMDLTARKADRIASVSRTAEDRDADAAHLSGATGEPAGVHGPSGLPILPRIAAGEPSEAAEEAPPYFRAGGVFAFASWRLSHHLGLRDVSRREIALFGLSARRPTAGGLTADLRAVLARLRTWGHDQVADMVEDALHGPETDYERGRLAALAGRPALGPSWILSRAARVALRAAYFNAGHASVPRLRVELDWASPGGLTKVDDLPPEEDARAFARAYGCRAEQVDPAGPGGGWPVWAFEGTADRIAGLLQAYDPDEADALLATAVRLRGPWTVAETFPGPPRPALSGGIFAAGARDIPVVEVDFSQKSLTS